jgi:hypothetical protein
MKRLCLFTSFRLSPLRAQQLRKLAYTSVKSFFTLFRRTAPSGAEVLRITTELYCLGTRQQRDPTDEEVVGLLQRLQGGFEQGQAALAGFQQAEDDSPEGWVVEGVWPDWVPAAARERIVKFWRAWDGRDLWEWQRDRVAQGAPPLGLAVTLPELVASVGDAPHALTGRYVHYWGNIGCLVLPDGQTATVSFAPDERWDGEVCLWGRFGALRSGQDG